MHCQRQTRLALSRTGEFRGIWHTATSIARTEGAFRPFFRGFVLLPTPISMSALCSCSEWRITTSARCRP